MTAPESTPERTTESSPNSKSFKLERWDGYAYQALLEELRALSEPEFQSFHSGLVPGESNILGVRTPALRRLAKEIAAGNRRSFLELDCGELYEEKVLRGMVVALGRESGERQRDDIAEFVPLIDSWAVCDIFCSSLKCIKKDREAYWDFLQSYLRAEKEFELRFPLVCLLGYYVDREYLGRVLAAYDAVRHDGYYVKMAVAWGVSVCMAKFPAETLEYLKDCALDDFTFNKAIQKSIESFRVTDGMKDVLRAMRRKKR